MAKIKSEPTITSLTAWTIRVVKITETLHFVKVEQDAIIVYYLDLLCMEDETQQSFVPAAVQIRRLRHTTATR
jgi:hypothetical protein